jgi:hypothetical protein
MRKLFLKRDEFIAMLLPAQDYSQQITWITLPAVNHRDGDKNIFFDFNLILLACLDFFAH